MGFYPQLSLRFDRSPATTADTVANTALHWAGRLDVSRVRLRRLGHFATTSGVKRASERWRMLKPETADGFKEL